MGRETAALVKPEGGSIPFVGNVNKYRNISGPSPDAPNDIFAIVRPLMKRYEGAGTYKHDIIAKQATIFYIDT